jgi:iron complex transport system permease protein
LKTREMTGTAKKRIHIAGGFLLLVVALVLLFFWNIYSGSVSVEPKDVLRLLFQGPDESTQARILWDIRFPRVLAAMLLGGALSVSGFLLQTFFANPIAGPFVLGISSGAKLMTALGRGLVAGSVVLILASFIGAMLSMGFVILIANKVNNMSILVICGIMVSYICSAVTDLVVTFADDSNIVNLHNWSLGSFSGITWENISVMAVVIFFCMICAMLMAKPAGAYQLGEIYAASMGVNIKAFRLALILVSSILSACVTAFAGPVSFVGIAVPQLVKSLFKTTKPIIMIPACFLGGAVFCSFCDRLARTLFSPVELSISTVTAVFGAPVVIYMMIQTRGRR